jgi:hypothetical protein
MQMSLINIVQLNLKQFENKLQKPASLKVKVYFFFEVYYIHSVPYAPRPTCAISQAISRRKRSPFKELSCTRIHT